MSRIRTAAAVAALLIGSGPMAGADSVTVSFEPFAFAAGAELDFGKAPTTPFELGAHSMDVIGPSQATYAGSIGLSPAPGPPFQNFGPDVELENGGETGPGPAGPGGLVLVSSISATFAPDSSGALDWTASIGAHAGTETTKWSGTISGVTTETFTPASPVAVIWHDPVAILSSTAADATQVLSITVNYTVQHQAAAPEPPGLVLAGLGLAGLGLAARRRRGRLTGTTGSCRASR